MDRLIDHVRNINNLTWLESFYSEILYLAVFSLYLFRELSVNRNYV